MSKEQIKVLEQDKKLYWKMIQTLQGLLIQQYQRELELMDQLEQCDNPIKVQIEESDQPLDQPIYETNYIPMAEILNHCTTK